MPSSLGGVPWNRMFGLRFARLPMSVSAVRQGIPAMTSRARPPCLARRLSRVALVKSVRSWRRTRPKRRRPVASEEEFNEEGMRQAVRQVYFFQNDTPKKTCTFCGGEAILMAEKWQTCTPCCGKEKCLLVAASFTLALASRDPRRST